MYISFAYIYTSKYKGSLLLSVWLGCMDDQIMRCELWGRSNPNSFNPKLASAAACPPARPPARRRHYLPLLTTICNNQPPSLTTIDHY